MRLVMREEFDRHAVNTLKGFDRTPPKYFNNSQQNKRQQNLALFLSVGCASYNKSNYCFLHQFISTINKRSDLYRWEFQHYFSFYPREKIISISYGVGHRYILSVS